MPEQPYSRTRCCDSHHYEGCCDGTPGCCPACPINPWRDAEGMPTTDYLVATSAPSPKRGGPWTGEHGAGPR